MFLRSILSILILFFFIFIGFLGISKYNLSQIKPTPKEITTIVNNFGDIHVKDTSDIIRIQNKSFDLIEYDGEGLNHHERIVIDSLFKWKKALCFHRSMLLQKIFLYNNIEVVPVFLYFDKKDPAHTSLTDILDKDLNSHNVFQINYNDKLYLIQTNQRMKRMITLDEYFQITTMPKGTKYIRHLNNRNGIYIYPSWLPDIY